MLTLLDFPPEIIHHITGHLNPHDRAQLLASCQALRDTITALTWRHLVLRIKSPRLPQTKSLTPKEPFFIQHLGDPLNLSSFQGPKPRTTTIGSEIGSAGAFCDFCKAVYNGYYDQVFIWIETLTVDIPLEKLDFNVSIAPKATEEFDKLTVVQLGYWFLLNALPKFSKVKSVQLESQLGSNFETLSQTILPELLKKTPSQATNQICMIGNTTIDVDITKANNVEFLRISPSSPGVSTNITSTATTKTSPAASPSNHLLPTLPTPLIIPSVLKRFDLLFEETKLFTSLELSKLFSNCPNLHSLELLNIRLTDDNNTWLPQGLVELSLQNTNTENYFLIPKEVVPTVTFLHLYSDGSSGVLDGPRMAQIQQSFPNLNNLYIERFKIQLEFMDYLNPLLPKLEHFSFMGMLGYYFEDFDLSAILSSGLRTLLMGQCYFITVEYLENLDIPHKMDLLRLRPSVGYDEESPAMFARVIKALARFTARLQVDLYHYRWHNLELYLFDDLLHEVPNSEFVASKADTSHYLFEVDLEQVWKKGVNPIEKYGTSS